MYWKSQLGLAMLTCLACPENQRPADELSLDRVTQHLGIDTTAFIAEDTVFLDSDLTEERVFKPNDETREGRIVITKAHHSGRCDESFLRQWADVMSYNLRLEYSWSKAALLSETRGIDGTDYTIIRCEKATVVLACTGQHVILVNAFGIDIKPTLGVVRVPPE